MTTLNISLPETLREFIETQSTQDGYSTPSEYICALVKEAQKQKAREKVEDLLLEGLNSGEPVEMTAQEWSDIRREVYERHARRNGS
jgi:antitoxin ParD1/3/4